MSLYLMAVTSENMKEQRIQGIGEECQLILEKRENRFLQRYNKAFWLITAFEGDITEGIKVRMETVDTTDEEIDEEIDEEMLSVLKELLELIEKKECNFEKDEMSGKRNLQNLSKFLMKMICEEKKESVGIFLHCYTGLIDEEKIELESVCEKVKNSDDIYNLLQNMHRDILYMFEEE